ncbi:MAG: sulfotransferase domain-containing protein [Pyrinomonadaceae bacterium]|nr:sulfotransferase domain-containing protein [Pyrinomonadaceae bacterium]
MSGIYWLASYPKSGNTWLRAFLTNYLRNADEPADINELDASGVAFNRYQFDEYVGIESSDLTPKQIEHYRPLVYEKMSDETEEPVFLKVHDAFTYNSEGQPIFSKKATAGVIYLVRNPLDVAVSYAHHSRQPIDTIIRIMGQSDKFLVSSDDGDQLPQKLMSWSEHVSSWLDAPDMNLLTVKYEDMISDSIGTFEEIVRFSGLELDRNCVKKSVEFSSFEKLKAQELEKGFYEKYLKAESFFRKGKAGSWRESLTAVQVEQFISEHGAVMKRLGYVDANGTIPS